MNRLKELKIIFDTSEDKDLITELLSDCFYKNDISGVVTESPQELNEDWGEDAVVYDRYSVSGYINMKEEEKIDIIKNDVKDILKGFNVKTEYEVKEIKEEDWANSWKDFFYPVEVSENIVIKPTWRNLEKDYSIVINIDPGMAFGSGSHPTTTLCIKHLEDTVKKGDKVLDVGCGSGILMIAAAKLGAEYLKGSDNDAAAVEISKANLRLNNIDDLKFNVLKSDLAQDAEEKYDVITANILADVIIKLIPDLKRVSHKNTSFIFSGIIEEKKEEVLKKMMEFNIEPVKIYEDSGWSAIKGIYQ
jgi:ribosomal protein L11 methyltransferase